MNPIEHIQNLIAQALPGAQVFASDPNQDGQHFQVLVVSETFVGMPLIKQHQAVLNALKAEFAENVHAVQVKTFTPERWEQQQAL